MLTLYHSPMSRSTTILALAQELGITDQINVETVSINRADGSGGPDARNPHPDKQVPYLVNGDDTVRERGAIVAYLTDMFPGAGLGRPVGHPQRGAFLSWLFYYQGVMEPVLVLDWAKIDHPVVQGTFRNLDCMVGHLAAALKDQAYLLGQEFSAVDLLLSSPFQWLPDALPAKSKVRDWVERCSDRPALIAAAKLDQSMT